MYLHTGVHTYEAHTHRNTQAHTYRQTYRHTVTHSTRMHTCMHEADVQHTGRVHALFV